MLARQQIAAKVVYTTHSAGCLPEDLGNGVHLARPLHQDEMQSEVVNKFWAENELGFAPLLFGMGASTLAFFPTRHAVMVEGPADMLLMPTMFREALNLGVLGFQFVPGLSIANDDEFLHAQAIGRAKGIMYLLDTDSGGAILKKKLLKRVHRDDIFDLATKDGAAVETEDFIDPELLIEAANIVLKKRHPRMPLFVRAELVDRHRMAELESAYHARTRKKLPKVDLAYEVLDLILATPGRRILDPARRKEFRATAASMLRRFAVMARNSIVT
jgi:predicted ATP-dependent endonuclease of OLD family